MTDDNVHPFAKYATIAWPHRFAVTLGVPELHGGTPRNEKVAVDWLRTKLGVTDEDRLREMAQEVVRETPDVSDSTLVDESVRRLIEQAHLNGFRRDPMRGLFIEGRHLKAAIKEAAMVARASNKLPDRWGTTRKGLKGFVAEHIMVAEDRIYLDRSDCDFVHQRFVVTRWGTGIQHEEAVIDAKVQATILADYDFTEQEWAMIWLTGEQQGLGASRSQGFGRYVLLEWRRLDP